MNYYGLFVGIDKYASSYIPNLTCSSRDAQAFYALFSDTFGGDNAILLTNETATNDGIRKDFETRLWNIEQDDLVLLAFSGHGSDSHHLVTYDADPLNLDATTIHLDELTELFSRIPAKNVILFLDCCFAGGAGAKVFHPDYAKKDTTSTDDLLRHIAGEGRVIFAAVKSDQEAIEDRKRKHSIFTYYVLEALRGAPEIVRSGRIPLLSMVGFVTRRVTEAANQFRHQQEPSFRGAVEGEVSFPVFSPGQIYRQYFPDQVAVPIGSPVIELKAYGFPEQLLDVWKGTISNLNELQLASINEFGLFEGTHLVVSAPTSSGKTMIGELAALKAYLNRERSYFLLPLRALVNDKYADFVRKYGAYGVRTIRSTGEIADDNDALMRGKFDIALLTYERFAALAVTNPHLLRQVGLVVVDEVQMIADRSRGANLEFLLTLLKSQRRLGVEPQMIALSAVIGDTNRFEEWLSARLLRSDKRPVPLEEGTLAMNGAFHFLAGKGEEKREIQYIMPEYRKGSSQDIIIPLVRKLVNDGEKVIVFRETKPIVRSTANYLRRNLGLASAHAVIDSLPTGDPSEASRLLRECVLEGVAFHNADLDREERRVIEEAFRDPNSGLNVLVATTTLAMGVNTPAWSVIIAGLQHPDGPYSVAEYKNMVGRAGRLGFTPKGKSFLIATSSGEEYQYWTHYVTGKPEDIRSRFAETDSLSLICRVLATAVASRISSMSEEDILDFIQDSFGAYQHKRQTSQALWSRNELIEAIQRLRANDLVGEREGQYYLTELGKVAGESGTDVVSIIRLVQALRGVSGTELTDSALVAAAQVTKELDDVFFPIHRRSTQERDRWQGAILQQRLPRSILATLRSTAKDEADYTCRCKKVAAILMWIDGIEINKLEASLLRHLPGDNAAGQIRAITDRTRDLLNTVVRVAELLSDENIQLGTQVEELTLRLELGIPQSMVWLGTLAGQSLDRGDYLNLFRANIVTQEQLLSSDDKTLASLLIIPRKVEAMKWIKERLSKQKAMNAHDDTLPMPRIPG